MASKRFLMFAYHFTLNARKTLIFSILFIWSLNDELMVGWHDKPQNHFRAHFHYPNLGSIEAESERKEKKKMN